MISGASILLDAKSRRDATATERTVSVLKQIADLKVLVRGAESAARGFALTGDIFNFFVFFELMSTVAFALTGYRLESSALASPIRRRLPKWRSSARRRRGPTPGTASIRDMKRARARSLRW